MLRYSIIYQSLMQYIVYTIRHLVLGLVPGVGERSDLNIMFDLKRKENCKENMLCSPFKPGKPVKSKRPIIAGRSCVLCVYPCCLLCLTAVFCGFLVLFH